MGCLNSTNTKVQPFDHSRENGHFPNSQKDKIVKDSQKDEPIKNTKKDTHVQNGQVQPITQGNKLTPSEQKPPISTLQQNGHIPSSKTVDTPSPKTLGTPREALKQQHQEDRSNTETYTHKKETEQKVKEAPKATTAEPTPLEHEPLPELTIQMDPETESKSEQNTARATEGNRSQLSTNREPVLIPTMPISEEDLLKSHYTIKEISKHNKEKKYIDIFPFKDFIYSTTKFKKAIKQAVELKYEKFKQEEKIVEPYDYEDFNEKWMSSPIYLVMFRYRKMHIRFADIRSELPGCKVAEIFKDDEMSKDIVADSKTILQTLKSDSKLTEYKKEYKELLERFLEICDKADSDPKSLLETKIPKGKDPNTIEFPLPQQIQANLKVLRKWIEKWEPFITEIPEGGVWTELPDNVVNAMSDPVDLQDICRVSADGLPSFDFTIEGEAAWDVIELDIVKHDKATAEQERIWRSRENRTDLNDPSFLLRRQTRLEMYFINKYEWESSKLDPYRGFSSRLHRGWKEFQDLCKVDEFTVMPEDEY